MMLGTTSVCGAGSLVVRTTTDALSTEVPAAGDSPFTTALESEGPLIRKLS